MPMTLIVEGLGTWLRFNERDKSSAIKNVNERLIIVLMLSKTTTGKFQEKLAYRSTLL